MQACLMSNLPLPGYSTPCTSSVPEQMSQVKVLEKRPEQGRRKKPARRGERKIFVRQCELVVSASSSRARFLMTECVILQHSLSDERRNPLESGTAAMVFIQLFSHRIRLWPHVDHIRLWQRPKTGLCP